MNRIFIGSQIVNLTFTVFNRVIDLPVNYTGG